jgi:outer membrane protein assembly factor BamB
MKVKKIMEYKLKEERNITSRHPLIIDDKLIVPFIFDKKGFVSSRIICLNKSNFEVLWNFDYSFVINNILKSPANNLLVCCMDGKLLEIDINDSNSISSFDLKMDRNGQSSIIEDDKIIISGVQGTKITNCFDFKSSQIKWTFDNGGHSYIPHISKDKVYQCTEHNIRCLDLNSGDLIWEANEETTYIFNPVSFKDMIAVGGHGLVNMYDSNNGKLLHQIKTENRESIRNIISKDDCIYFGDSSGVFYAYQIDRKKRFLESSKTYSELLWKFQSNGGIESMPAIYGENVMFINDDNKLICLKIRSGEFNCDFNTKGKAGVSGIIVVNRNIFTSVGKGYVYNLTEEN